MRVTHVITRLIIGGAQENTVSSVLGLREKPGLQVDLISGRSEGPEGSLEPLFDAHPGTLRIMPDLVRPIRPTTDWRALRKLREMFLSERPDIVHTHSGKAGIVGRLAAEQARVPVIIHTIHGPSFGAFQGKISNLVFRCAEARAAKATTHFVTVANAMKDQYLAAGIGRPEQYTRVFSGFRLEPFLAAENDPELRRQFGLTPENVVVGTVARLVPLKGHADLFAVAAKLVKRCPQIRFLLVGDGPLRAEFENLARSLGLRTHFVFAGLVAPEKVPQLIGIMDLLVHLSSREGLARALPQALAVKRPVVAYDCDGAREICMDGRTGFLIPFGNLEVLEERVVQLVTEPELRARLGEQGRQFVRDRFPVQRMVDDLYELYHKLASTSAPAGSESDGPRA